MQQFRPRLVAGLDVIDTVRSPAPAPAPVISRAAHVFRPGREDIASMTFLASFPSAHERRDLAGVIRLADLGGAGISDLVATIGAFVSDLADEAFGEGFDPDAWASSIEALREYGRIRFAASNADGRSVDVLREAFERSAISLAFDHADEGIDIVRDITILLDAERSGMILSDIASAIVEPI